MPDKIKSRTFFWKMVADTIYKEIKRYYPHTYVRDVCNGIKTTELETTRVFLAAVTVVQERLKKSGITINERKGSMIPVITNKEAA